MFSKTSINFQTKTLLESRITRRAISVRGLVVHSDDYQYLQNSRLPTLHFQKSLPRLPIPKLEKTCERFLEALKPLLSDDEYSETKKLVQEFKNNDGKSLHEILEKSDVMNNHTSYISKPWFDMYLSDRSPLPINYNPVLVFNKSKQPDNDSQLIRASNLIISSARFLKSFRKNILNPDVYHLNPKKSDTNVFKIVTRLLPSAVSWYGAYAFKAFPLDMSQYSNLFNSTRIPKMNKDILYKDEAGKHILVLRKGHFFVFDVFDKNGDILPPEHIFTCLKYILAQDFQPNTESLGILTTENRDIWAKAREHLESLSKENVDNFKIIDSSLFALCLDDEKVDEDPIKMMKSFIHGNGYNRWFDKSFSLLISKDSVAAVNFEHSWGDGVAILRYFQDLHADTDQHAFVHSNTNVANVTPEDLVRELSFQSDMKVETQIKTAKAKFEKICEDLSFDVVECKKLGKDNCKVSKISPDSIMQLAFQVAYHRAYGDFVATYESCSTAAFKHGRTETIRPCTSATKQFALSINRNNRPSQSELMELMMSCSTVHGNLTKNAAMGQGFDRHLFALKHVANEMGRKIPDLFNHVAYKKINYNILSTSTLASSAVLIGGFGPVVPDGLGVGYTIANDRCGSIVSSYPAHRKGSQFSEALESTFNDLSEILCSKRSS